ncbi:hypothetical protein ICR95_20950 [Priestia megaterium]|uniref:hypothetical protein n=1 Tax=Priestia megaterium TaxID=1404 RepID=UPI00196BB1F6|nr:hypothetical protein [Priestia megaterium]QSF32538.1 hypothetical protein ICR95_20950 [Priestia megaterium]
MKYPYKQKGNGLGRNDRNIDNQNIKDIESDIKELLQRVENLILNASTGEIQANNARLDALGILHKTLKVRLDYESTKVIDIARLEENSIPSSKLRTTSQADRIGLQNLNDEVLQAMAGNTPINSIPADNSVTNPKYAPSSITNDKLSEDIKTKGYPFVSTANVPKVMRDAVLEMKMYNGDQSKQYCMPVLRRNIAASGNLWNISIYEWVNGAFGTKICEFNKSNYVPTSNKEVIRLSSLSSSNIFVDLTIDWSKVPDGTDLSSKDYTLTGLHPLVYIGRTEWNSVIDSKVNTAIDDQVKIKRYPFQKDSSPSSVLKNSIIDLKLFNADDSKQYVLAVARKDFSTGTAILKIYEWTGTTFGANVCQLDKSVGYIPVTTKEKVILSPTVTGTKIRAEITIDWSQIPDGTDLSSMGYDKTGLHPLVYIGRKDDASTSGISLPAMADLTDIGNPPSTSVISNSSTLDMTNGNVSAISVTFTNQNVKFNIFEFPGSTVSSAKYVFCIIRTSSGATKEKHIKEYKEGTQMYRFVTSRVYNLKEDVQVIFGYCDGNFITVKQTNLPLASSTTDQNLIGSVIKYLAPDSNIDVEPINAGNVNWKSTNYNLKYLDYGTMNFLPTQPSGSPSDVVTNQFDMILPPKIYLPSNKELWLYHSSASENEHIRKKKPVDINVSSKSPDGLTVYTDTLTTYYDRTILKGNKSHDVTFDFRDWSKSSQTSKRFDTVASKKVSILSKVVTPGKIFNTLMVGDSYLDIQWGDGVFNHMKAFAASDGNTINFKGTRTSYGNLGEARASWAESTFRTRYVPMSQRVDVNGDPTSANMSSPFVFSSDDTVANAKFDFAQYLSVNAITSIDNIVFFLGMNGGDGSGINTMIANIKATLPNVNIFVCMIPPAEEWRLNMDSIARQNDRITRNKNYISLFQNRESTDRVYLIPTHANFHRTASLNNNQTNLYQFSDINNGTETLVTDHHPNNLGAKGIAYLIYCYLCYAN